jgi:hypothetical protein
MTSLLALIAALSSASASPGATGTIAIVAEADEGPLPRSTLESVLWHALYEDMGHDARFLPTLDATAIAAMRDTTMTTLLHVRLAWKTDAVHIQLPEQPSYFVAGHYPSIETTEYALQGDLLVARRTWRTEGPVSVYRVRDDRERHYIGLPEVSLQETASHALRPVQAPVWRSEIDWLHVPVVLAADEEYRSFYGEDRWHITAGRALDRANAILRPAGIQLRVAGHQEWQSPDGLTDLSDLLKAMATHPHADPAAIRIGFTGQTRLAVAWQAEMEDVGRAYMPGRDVLVADQAVAPGHDPAWDVADEGVAIAHEVLHALGIPHLQGDDMLMSATKRGTVHAMSPGSIALARAAASARYTHWDTLSALVALSDAADTHLPTVERKLDYISDNLAYGPGVPAPGALEPREFSALTNVAIGRYYLRLATDNPTDAWRLQLGARLHTESALAQEPSWREARSLQRQIQAAQRAYKPPPTAPQPAPAPQPPEPEPAEPAPHALLPTCPLRDPTLPTCE